MSNSSHSPLKLYLASSGGFDVFVVASDPEEAAEKFLREIVLKHNPGHLGDIIRIRGEDGEWFKATLKTFEECVRRGL